jgi:DNA-binding beta-propeller fold protein YncE
LDFDNEDRLKVAHAATGEVTEWEVNADGSFTQVNTVSTGQNGVCWIRFNTKNKCVYTSNTGTGSISALSAAPGSDYQLADAAVFDSIPTPLDLISSTDGKNLYVLSSGVGDASGFPGIYAFSTGSDCGLTQLPTVRDGVEPVADQVTAQGIAVFPGNSWGLV